MTPPLPSDSSNPNGNDRTHLGWTSSFRPLIRALLFVIVAGAFVTAASASFPLWRPTGLLMLKKLWDVLRFVALATSVGLGIVNSKLWKESQKPVSRRGIDDDLFSDGSDDRTPFGLFHNELQSSYSFNERGTDIVEHENSGTSGVSEVGDARTAAGAAGANTAIHDNTKNTSTLESDTSFSASEGVRIETCGNTDAKLCRTDLSIAEQSSAGVVEEPSIDSISVGSGPDVPVTEKVNLPKAQDDLLLGASLPSKHGSSVVHRRGASLELTIHEDESWQTFGDPLHPPMELWQESNMEAAGERPMAKIRSSARNALSDQVRSQPNECSSSDSAMTEPVSATARKTISKHSRSRSAYDVSDLVAVQETPRRRRGPRGELARRRNVSLSCDLDKQYRGGGLASCPGGLLSPPMPPLVIGTGADTRTVPSNQDETSLRRAYTESLAPWRVESIAVPMGSEERIDAGRKVSEGRKEFSANCNQGQRSPRLSPLTEQSYMASPSPSELNKKVDAFIAKFHERIRLQRLESLERSRQRVN